MRHSTKPVLNRSKFDHAAPSTWCARHEPWPEECVAKLAEKSRTSVALRDELLYDVIYECWHVGLHGGATVGDVPIGASASTALAARELEPQIAEVCGQLNVLHAELTRLVGQAASTGAWQGQGIRSLSQWVQWKTGLAGDHVRRLVAIAEARATHPQITERFDEGRLSLDQAAMAVECEPGDDAEFAE